MLGPVVPLRDHITDYYLTLPAMCLAMLGGYALVWAWRQGAARKRLEGRERVAGCRLSGATRPVGRHIAEWFRERGQAQEALVMGVARAHELHPGKVILLDGVDDDLFWGAIEQRPFLFLRIPDVYLTPGSETHHFARIPSWTMYRSSSCPPKRPGAGSSADRDCGLSRRRRAAAQHYAPICAARRRSRRAQGPLRIDLGDPLAADRLGPGWYPLESGFRWMPRTASLRMPGPRTAGQRLYRDRHLPGGASARWAARDDRDRGRHAPGSRAVYERRRGRHVRLCRCPPKTTGKSEIGITVELSRTVRIGADTRDLGLAFGRFEIK